MAATRTAASRRVPLLLIATLLLSLLTPMALAEPESDDSMLEVMSGDLTYFTPSIEGKRYMFTDPAEPVFSATSFLKMEWRDAGYPGLILPFSPGYLNSRSSARTCENAWSQGESGNISTASGTVAVTVQKISANSAIRSRPPGPAKKNAGIIARSTPNFSNCSTPATGSAIC